MTVSPESVAWTRGGARVALRLRRRGSGPTLLLLPALSSISTLEEMAPLQDRLADRFATVALDWAGFGAETRPVMAWSRAALQAFLDHILAEVVPHPFATIAAGHAAVYLLDKAARDPGSAGRLVLVAPTWRGPLPTMMKGRSALGDAIARVGDIPLLGAALYQLNVNRPMVRFMAREHVYSDRNWLDGEKLAAKMAVVRASGARHAALRFVTGLLDPMDDRAAFLLAAQRLRDPALVVYGVETPVRSKAEMVALATLPTIASVVLPRGKLAMHEEYPDAVAGAIRPFLDG